MEPNAVDQYQINECSDSSSYKGIPIPNRVFVGGLPTNARENELRNFFLSYGYVKDVKIIYNKNSTKRNYGFVTFDNQQTVERLVEKDSREKIYFKSRHLNIGYAYKKIRAKPGAPDNDHTENSLVSTSDFSCLYDNSIPVVYLASHENSFVASQGFFPGTNSSPIAALPHVNKPPHSSIAYNGSDHAQQQTSRSPQPTIMNDSVQSSVLCTPPSLNQSTGWRFSIPPPFMTPLMTPMIGGSSPQSMPLISPLQYSTVGCSEVICIYGAQYPLSCDLFQGYDAATTLPAATVNNASPAIEQ